jgi:thioester reductase-like protein
MSITPEYHTLGAYLGERREIEALQGKLSASVEATKEELRAAYQRIQQLEADLIECREYLEDHVDVVDGDYGEPRPNRAMQLVSLIDESLHGPGNF